jgi:hypothetical protein
MERVGLDAVHQLDTLVSGDRALLLDLSEKVAAPAVSRRLLVLQRPMPTITVSGRSLDELAEVLGVTLRLGVETILERSALSGDRTTMQPAQNDDARRCGCAERPAAEASRRTPAERAPASG